MPNRAWLWMVVACTWLACNDDGTDGEGPALPDADTRPTTDATVADTGFGDATSQADGASRPSGDATPRADGASRPSDDAAPGPVEVDSGRPVGPQGGDSPFGFHPARVSKAGYDNNGFGDAEHLGLGWAREPVYAIWALVEPDLSAGEYDFSMLDRQWRDVPATLRILGNITANFVRNPRDGYSLPNSYLPADEGRYRQFVRATVERYDGDGIDDLPGLASPIRHWQVGNEPNNTRTSDFAALQRISYEAIKQACETCVVMIGGVAGFPPRYIHAFDEGYRPILEALGGQYVDVFDFHWYGDAGGDYRFMDSMADADVYDHIRAALSDTGFPDDLPIWITEMGAYSGAPEPAGRLTFPPQTERQQAQDYFKRFIYSLARGVEKVFPAFGLIEGFQHANGYFDLTGIIYDGEGSGDLGLGVKKLGYYTIKKMIEKLDGADWGTLHMRAGGADTDYVYLFQIVRRGRPILILWWDYFEDESYTPGDTRSIPLRELPGSTVTVTSVVPNAELGRDVADYGRAFSVDELTITDSGVDVEVGEDPVIVEALD